MRQWFQRFMYGRYGNDQLGRFTLIVSLACVLLGSLLFRPLYYVGVLLLGWSYYRLLSRNHSKRYAENMKYLQLKSQVSGWLASRKVRFQQRGLYRYYRCPRCRKEIRIPKGHGRVSITCPQCRTQFIKKS